MRAVNRPIGLQRDWSSFSLAGPLCWQSLWRPDERRALSANQRCCRWPTASWSTADQADNHNVSKRVKASYTAQTATMFLDMWQEWICHLTLLEHSEIQGLPKDWRRPPGRPRHTWLCTLKADLQLLNLGLNSARKYTQDREHWNHLVETATLQLGGCMIQHEYIKTLQLCISSRLQCIQHNHITSHHISKLHSHNPSNC